MEKACKGVDKDTFLINGGRLPQRANQGGGVDAMGDLSGTG
jgi:hypothetical protein